MSTIEALIKPFLSKKIQERVSLSNLSTNNNSPYFQLHVPQTTKLTPSLFTLNFKPSFAEFSEYLQKYLVHQSSKVEVLP